MGDKLEEFRTVEHIRLDGNVRELSCRRIQLDFWPGHLQLSLWFLSGFPQSVHAKSFRCYVITPQAYNLHLRRFGSVSKNRQSFQPFRRYPFPQLVRYKHPSFSPFIFWKSSVDKALCLLEYSESGETQQLVIRIQVNKKFPFFFTRKSIIISALIMSLALLTLWRRNFLLNFSTPCI
jgi:hypothetical protein